MLLLFITIIIFGGMSWRRFRGRERGGSKRSRNVSSFGVYNKHRSHKSAVPASKRVRTVVKKGRKYYSVFQIDLEVIAARGLDMTQP